MPQKQPSSKIFPTFLPTQSRFVQLNMLDYTRNSPFPRAFYHPSPV